MDEDDEAKVPRAALVGGARSTTARASALPLTRRVPLLWTLVALAIVALTSLSALVLLTSARGPRPSFLDARPAGTTSAPPAPRPVDGALVLAGSGTNLPLTRALAGARGRRSFGTRALPRLRSVVRRRDLQVAPYEATGDEQRTAYQTRRGGL